MYNSLKSWLNIPVQILPYVKRTGTGAKQFAEPTDTLCYILGEVTVVKDQDGQEVVSNSQIYLDGSETISALDRIIINGKQHDIKTINSFYRSGVVDIKVVYI